MILTHINIHLFKFRDHTQHKTAKALFCQFCQKMSGKKKKTQPSAFDFEDPLATYRAHPGTQTLNTSEIYVITTKQTETQYGLRAEAVIADDSTTQVVVGFQANAAKMERMKVNQCFSLKLNQDGITRKGNADCSNISIAYSSCTFTQKNKKAIKKVNLNLQSLAAVQSKPVDTYINTYGVVQRVIKPKGKGQMVFMANAKGM